MEDLCQNGFQKIEQKQIEKNQKNVGRTQN